jgi:hypothetical protein
LNGHSFLFSSSDINSIQSAIDLIGIISFSGEIKSPSTFQEAVHILSQPSFINYEKQFEQSCQLIAEHFSNLTEFDFHKLTTRALERILSLETLCLPNEKFLFEKINQDPAKMDLMKFVIFPALDYRLLLTFFEKLRFGDINVDLFEQFKMLFSFLKKIFQRIDGETYPQSFLLINFNILFQFWIHFFQKMQDRWRRSRR